MTDPHHPSAPPASCDCPVVTASRPRIAIMGEFSAGKSTLTNLLIGDSVLPTRITATQLPPVWVSDGEGQDYAERLDGTRYEIDVAHLPEIDISTTRFLRVFKCAAILSHCDLIDFPGISDPNMHPDVWQRMVPLADGVLWCTHATQAWRQSEAAVWEDMPAALHSRALLLLTRADRLPSPRDRDRVVARVARETEGLFAGILPVSLTEARDPALWETSGARAMVDALQGLCAGIAQPEGASVPARDAGRAETGRAVPSPGGANDRENRRDDGKDRARVMPRRVRAADARGAAPLARGASRGAIDGAV